MCISISSRSWGISDPGLRLNMLINSSCWVLSEPIFWLLDNWFVSTMDDVISIVVFIVVWIQGVNLMVVGVACPLPIIEGVFGVYCGVEFLFLTIDL